MAQVSLAWSLTRVTAPIIGSTSIEKFEDLISALCSLCNVAVVIKYLLADGVGVKLAEEDILYLEEPYQARSVMGHK